MYIEKISYREIHISGHDLFIFEMIEHRKKYSPGVFNLVSKYPKGIATSHIWRRSTESRYAYWAMSYISWPIAFVLYLEV